MRYARYTRPGGRSTQPSHEYVVTVKRRLAGRTMVPTADAGLQPLGCERYEVVSRETVATLAEARRKASEVTLPYALALQPADDRALAAACAALPEQGGTVTLPDGRVITVEPGPS